MHMPNGQHEVQRLPLVSVVWWRSSGSKMQLLAGFHITTANSCCLSNPCEGLQTTAAAARSPTAVPSGFQFERIALASYCEVHRCMPMRASRMHLQNASRCWPLPLPPAACRMACRAPPASCHGDCGLVPGCSTAPPINLLRL